MLHKVQAALEHWALEGETILVAVSGGVDSLVLLHTLAHWQAHFGYALHVATFDHQLRGESSRADAAYVAQMAKKLGLAVTVGSEDVARYAAQQHLSLEAAARQARYTFLIQTADEHNAFYIALGHHRDDQVETILMHLLRGAGLAGLRGMLPFAPLSETHLREDAPDALFEVAQDLTLLRPLLDISREEIEHFAHEQGIVAREDETNQDTHFFRNQLRHELLPVLARIKPDYAEALARMATIAQADYEVIQLTAQKALARMVDWGETDAGEIAYLDRSAFLAELPGVQRHILREILTELSSIDIPYAHIESACNMIACGTTGQQMSLPSDLKMTLGYDDVTIHSGETLPFPRHIPHLPAEKVIYLDLESEGYTTDFLRFYTYWVVDGRSTEIYRDNPLEATLAVTPGAELTLRTRRPGDRFTPLGLGGHSQKISDVFINLKIPKIYRDRVPLLLVNDEIAWFVAPTANGLQGRVSEHFAVREDTESVLRVRWTFSD